MDILASQNDWIVTFNNYSETRTSKEGFLLEKLRGSFFTEELN